MKPPFLTLDASQFTIAPFETKPLKGYRTPKDKITKMKLPYCCNFHKSIFEQSRDKLKLTNSIVLPLKIVTQVSYTEYHISKSIELDTWYKDITDYIEYTFTSYGHPATGVNLYLNAVKHFIENSKPKKYKFPIEKRNKIIAFIVENYFKESIKTDTSLNTLYLTYHKWLSVFPFQISYFHGIKEKLSDLMPFLAEEPITNQYLGIAKAKSVTNDELVSILIQSTQKILQFVGEKNKTIENRYQHLIELTNEAHRIKQNALLNKFSNDEKEYVEIMEQWLSNEKIYFKEISILSDQQTNAKETKLNKISREEPKCFNDVFIDEDWNKYINILQKTKPKILDTKKHFIGSERRDKGVICSWIKYLQNKGKIFSYINRKQLSFVLNNEIKDLNLGKDGKTFNNHSSTFEDVVLPQIKYLIDN